MLQLLEPFVVSRVLTTLKPCVFDMALRSNVVAEYHGCAAAKRDSLGTKAACRSLSDSMEIKAGSSISFSARAPMDFRTCCSRISALVLCLPKRA